ncbi:MAG: serine/threonine protein kinase [Verrucomicrobia bacterium]|nr:serine/threonine protein kinase [Verrucomicrobiota bacterium]
MDIPPISILDCSSAIASGAGPSIAERRAGLQAAFLLSNKGARKIEPVPVSEKTRELLQLAKENNRIRRGTTPSALPQLPIEEGSRNNSSSLTEATERHVAGKKYLKAHLVPSHWAPYVAAIGDTAALEKKWMRGADILSSEISLTSPEDITEPAPYMAQLQYSIRAALRERGVHVGGTAFGSGGYGTVYPASLMQETNQEERYVFKFENNKTERELEKKLVTAPEKFWRVGDLAASRINVPYMTVPLSVVLAVKRSPESKIEYHYIDATKAKKFGKKLLKEAPQKKAIIVAQLMARSPGDELYDHLFPKDAAPQPIDTREPLFTNLVTSLGSFFEEVYVHNYAHFDIKPENIIVNKTTGECMIIDGGVAARGTRRFIKGASDQQEKTTTKSDQLLTNQRHFISNQGTLPYMHPIFWGKATQLSYQSEVDAYSIAMTLLETIIVY